MWSHGLKVQRYVLTKRVRWSPFSILLLFGEKKETVKPPTGAAKAQKQQTSVRSLFARSGQASPVSTTTAILYLMHLTSP